MADHPINATVQSAMQGWRVKEVGDKERGL